MARLHFAAFMTSVIAMVTPKVATAMSYRATLLADPFVDSNASDVSALAKWAGAPGQRQTNRFMRSCGAARLKASSISIVRDLDIPARGAPLARTRSAMAAGQRPAASPTRYCGAERRRASSISIPKDSLDLQLTMSWAITRLARAGQTEPIPTR